MLVKSFLLKIFAFFWFKRRILTADKVKQFHFKHVCVIHLPVWRRNRYCG